MNLLNSEIENMVKDAQRRIRNSFYTEDVKPEYLPDKIDYKPLNVVGLKKLFDTFYLIWFRFFSVGKHAFKKFFSMFDWLKD